MIALSIAIVIVAGFAFFLVNKYLNQRQQVLDRQYEINSKSTEVELEAAIEQLHKQLDSRINKAFENHQLIKTELDSLKLSLGLKRAI